jgi:hypothetical protein
MVEDDERNKMDPITVLTIAPSVVDGALKVLKYLDALKDKEEQDTALLLMLFAEIRTNLDVLARVNLENKTGLPFDHQSYRNAAQALVAGVLHVALVHPFAKKKAWDGFFGRTKDVPNLDESKDMAKSKGPPRKTTIRAAIFFVIHKTDALQRLAGLDGEGMMPVQFRTRLRNLQSTLSFLAEELETLPDVKSLLSTPE